MCRIAEVLIALQQVGNVTYTGWIFQVPCSRIEEIVTALQQKANAMEKEFSQWKRLVTDAREEFYELNYFTTAQLLALRKELSMERQASDVAPNVLFLLQSISSQVTSRGVRDVVNSVLAPTAFSQPCLESPVQGDTGEAAVVTPRPSDSLELNRSPECEPKIFDDMPKLVESELNDKQREILEFVTRVLDCSRFLVLKAFEQCEGKDMDKYDYRDWCSDNLDVYEFEDEREESESEGSQDDDAIDTDTDTEQTFIYSPGKYS